MLKRMLIMLIAVALVFGAVFGFEAFKNKMIKQFISGLSNPPQTVSTIVAKSQTWSSTLEAVGSARAINGVNLSAQVAGTVAAIHFESDSDVKQGTPLLELSAADDIAHLDALKATTELARITYERDKTLLSTKAVSQQTVDSDKWALANDEAREVLIFKMAVALGFDAPRAWTLVSMRAAKDEDFGVQLVGREARYAPCGAAWE